MRKETPVGSRLMEGAALGVGSAGIVITLLNILNHDFSAVYTSAVVTGSYEGYYGAVLLLRRKFG